MEHISRQGTAVPVTWFPFPEESELPEGLQGLFLEAGERVGSYPTCSGLQLQLERLWLEWPEYDALRHRLEMPPCSTG